MKKYRIYRFDAGKLIFRGVVTADSKAAAIAEHSRKYDVPKRELRAY